MKSYKELQNASFYDANARERAIAMVDKGTFTELLGPLDRLRAPICRSSARRSNLTTAR